MNQGGNMNMNQGGQICMNFRMQDSNLRRFLLLTLKDLSRRESITKTTILERIQKCFSCSSIIVTQEGYPEKGQNYYYAGIKNSDARKNNASRILKEAFPEFEEAQMNVSFFKAWKTL